MKKAFILAFCIALLLLNSSSAKGPSNKEIKELICGVFLREASIISKDECDGAATEINSALWLIYFIYEGDDHPCGWLLEESTAGQWLPIRLPKPNATCPEKLYNSQS